MKTISAKKVSIDTMTKAQATKALNVATKKVSNKEPKGKNVIEDLVNKKVTARIVNMTPMKAKEILQKNSLNRPIKDDTVSRYKRLMEKNDFMLNGDTIKISWLKILLDGQHRLTAISKMPDNFSVQMIIVENLDPECFSTLDCGSPRTAKDILVINGYTEYAAIIPTILRCYYKNAILQVKSKHAGLNRDRSLTNTDVLKYVRENPKMYTDIAHIINTKYIKHIGNAVLIGATMLKLIRDDKYSLNAVIHVAKMLGNPMAFQNPNPEIIKIHNLLLSQKELNIKMIRVELMSLIMAAFKSVLDK